jgi:hypothetical protein
MGLLGATAVTFTHVPPVGEVPAVHAPPYVPLQPMLLPPPIMPAARAPEVIPVPMLAVLPPVIAPKPKVRKRRAAPSTPPQPMGEVEAIIREIFPDEAEPMAMLVAKRESNFQPTAQNRSGARGVYQIMPLHANLIASLGFTWEQMREARPNIVVAHALWLRSSWGPWRCGRCSLR